MTDFTQRKLALGASRSEVLSRNTNKKPRTDSIPYASSSQIIPGIENADEHDDVFDLDHDDAHHPIFPRDARFNGSTSALQSERARYKFHLGLINTAELLAGRNTRPNEDTDKA
jgi:hypothetical protein